MDTRSTQTIRALNALLQGELAAVAGYRQALASAETKPEVRPSFEECLSSHERRALRLQTEVVRRGGVAAARMAGTWRFLLALFTWASEVAGVTLLGPLLRWAEMVGLRRYDRVWPQLDERARQLVSWELFPQQVLTRQSMLLARIAWRGAPEG